MNQEGSGRRGIPALEVREESGCPGSWERVAEVRRAVRISEVKELRDEVTGSPPGLLKSPPV